MKKTLFTFIIAVTLGLAVFLTIKSLSEPCLAPGELPGLFIHEPEVPEYDPASFARRRQEIMDQLGPTPLLVSATAANDFYYLTGFDEYQGVAVLLPGDPKPFRMFVTPRNPADAMWTGERHGTEGAMKKFGADTAYVMNDLAEILPRRLSGDEKIFLHSRDTRLREILEGWQRETGQTLTFQEADSLIHEQRVIKDAWEIAQLEQAVAVTGKAHSWIMKTMAPGQREYEVQADIEYIFGKNGMTPGFASIVGSGPNATILHHIRNDRKINDGELLLVDIGAASRGRYTADITRTYPVNGQFTPEQRTIYDLVYQASETGLEKMKPGFKMLDCNHAANRVLVQGLYELGLIPDTTVWWQKRFYIQHRVNHYIGLSVHDVGDYGFDPAQRDEHILTPEIRGRDLEPGMVMTMEPGLYLQKNRLDYLVELFGHLATPEELDAFAKQVRPVYEKYAGIGVRIEDNVLITENGNKVLSGYLPKTSEEIEAAMRR